MTKRMSEREKRQQREQRNQGVAQMAQVSSSQAITEDDTQFQVLEDVETSPNAPPETQLPPTQNRETPEVESLLPIVDNQQEAPREAARPQTPLTPQTPARAPRPAAAPATREESPERTVEENYRERCRALERQARFDMVRHFTKVKLAESLVLIFGKLDPDSDDYGDAAKRYLGNIRSWKHIALRTMKQHVTDLLDIDSAENGIGYTLCSTAELKDFFAARYSTANFEQVFSFIQGYVDWDRCHDRVHAFARTIYVNLAIRMKRHLDWEADPHGLNHAWDKVLQFFDVMATRSTFDDLEANHFVRVHRHASPRKRKRSEAIHPDKDEDFVDCDAGPRFPSNASGEEDD
ncbi:MAG: hypothetical protein M1837_006342 [Sclerophora amabilis]|nr:MAG: hypothetical protein M1837_006342 [Sclerophora amabilis]